MQFSTKIDGFEQNDSQGFENSYNSCLLALDLEKFFIFTIYQKKVEYGFKLCYAHEQNVHLADRQPSAVRRYSLEVYAHYCK